MKKSLFVMAAVLLLSVSNAVNATVNFAVQPYLQSLTPTSVTIMWVTSGSNQVTGWVEYGTSSCSVQAFEYTRGLKQGFTKIYRVHIDDLTPGTTYQYKALIREITGFVGNTSLTWGDTKESSVYNFTTPTTDAASVSCLVFNDLHSHPEFIDVLLSTNSLSFANQDFVMLNGDILNAVPNEAEILNNMLVPMSQKFASKKPFFYTRGNHEYRNKYARNLLNYVETGADNQGYYSFTWGPCFFIVLDSGEDKEDSHAEYNGLIDCEAYRRTQVDWVKEQLVSEAYANAKFRIIFMHIPMYSNTSTARFSVGDCKSLFLDLFNQYKPDALICGHTHKAGVIAADAEHNFPIFIGGGKDIAEENAKYCPSVMQLKATSTNFDLMLYNYYGEVKGELHLTK